MSEGKSDIPDKSKRKFLELSAVGTAGIALGISANNAVQEVSKVEQIKIETSVANLYPMYEVHPHPPVRKDYEKIPNLDLHYAELQFGQDFTTWMDAKDILTMETVYKPHQFTQDVLDYFSQKKIEVAVEGQYIGEDLSNIAKASEFAEAFTAIVASGAEAYNSAMNKFDEIKTNRRGFFRKTIVGLGLIWAVAPAFRLDSDLVNSNRMQEEINKISSTTHPENFTVFFRNLLMARQLQVISKDLATNKKEKPNISFEVGKAHSGIEIFLPQSEEFLVSAICAYPKVVLQKVMDENKGIDTFCKTAIYNPDAIFHKRNGKQRRWVNDDLLATALKKKLTN